MKHPYGIDILLAGSAVSPAAFKSLYPIHVSDVSKQIERLTIGIVVAVAQWLRAANIFRQLC